MPATSAPARMRLRVDHYGAADAIITNPPYTRDVMHRLIEHFQRIAPTWLLLDTDWASTLQAVPFLGHCSDIVTIGRVKWFEGSKHTGKDNHAWYRFDVRHKGGPVFHRRGQSEVIPSRRTGICEQCGKRYECSDPVRGSARRHASSSAYRKRLSVTPSVTPAPNTAIEPSALGSVSLRPACRCPEVRGGRLAGSACARWHAPRRILGADATNRTGMMMYGGRDAATGAVRRRTWPLCGRSITVYPR